MQLYLGVTADGVEMASQVLSDERFDVVVQVCCDTSHCSTPSPGARRASTSKSWKRSLKVLATTGRR